MQDWLLPYSATISSLGAIGALLVVQIVVLDVAGMRAKHSPGSPVAADSSNFFFRATRAHGNTNESIALYIVLALYGMFSGASPQWLGTAAWAWVSARAAHMAFYYANIPIARSIAFGVGMLALLAMLGAGVAA